MLSYLRRNVPEAQRQRIRRRLARLSVVIAVLLAGISTYDAWPAPGKALRPVVVTEIVATWLSVIVAVLVVPFLQRRRQARTRIPGQPKKAG